MSYAYIQDTLAKLSSSISQNSKSIIENTKDIKTESENIRKLQLRVNRLYQSFNTIQFLSGPTPSSLNATFGINANINYYGLLLQKDVRTTYQTFLPTLQFTKTSTAYEINILAGSYFSNLNYFSITPYIYNSSYGRSGGSVLPYESWIAMGLNSQMYYTRFPQNLTNSSIISVIISFSYEYNQYFIQNINPDAFSFVLPYDLIQTSTFLFILRTSSSFSTYISNEVSIVEYPVPIYFKLTPLQSTSTSSNASVQNIISSSPNAIPIYPSNLISSFNDAFQTLLTELKSTFFIVPVFSYYSPNNNNVAITSYLSQYLNNASYASQLPSPQENNFTTSYIPIRFTLSSGSFTLQSITVLYLNPIAIQVGLAGSVGIYTSTRIELYTENTASIKETMVSPNYPTDKYSVPTYNYQQSTILLSDLTIPDSVVAIVVAERQSFPACNQMENTPEILAANYPLSENSNNLQPNSEIFGITIPSQFIMWANEEGVPLDPSKTPIPPNVSLSLPQANLNATTNFKVFAQYSTSTN